MRLRPTPGDAVRPVSHRASHSGEPNMRKELLIAAALSASLHIGILLGSDDSNLTARTIPIDNPSTAPAEKPKPQEEKKDPEKRDDPTIVDEDPRIPDIDCRGGLVDTFTTTISPAQLIQIIDNPNLTPWDPTKTAVSIPSGVERIPNRDRIAEAVAVSSRDLDHPPEAITTVEPNYPYSMRPLGIEGKVDLLIVVDTKGRVVSARVVNATNEEFARAALEAARKWRFHEGIRDGKIVNFKCLLPMHFNAPR